MLCKHLFQSLGMSVDPGWWNLGIEFKSPPTFVIIGFLNIYLFGSVGSLLRQVGSSDRLTGSSVVAHPLLSCGM